MNATGAPVAGIEPALRREFDAVAQTVGDNPEPAFAEVHAHRTLTRWLSKHRFSIGSVSDLPTAFVAQVGTGDPVVAVLLEYDALPDIGHGCGHHLIAAGGALTAILAARHRPSTGTILAIGCPAEESGAGKAHLVRAGCFEEVDAAMMFHPASRTVLARSSLAAIGVTVEFHGRAAHAAKAPEHGRNALTAMVLLFGAVDAYRSRLGRWGRVNGIITHGGGAANVIPDYTRAEFMVRESTEAGVHAMVDQLRGMASGAAECTGTRAEVRTSGLPYAERRNNRTMLRALAQHLDAVGLAVDQPEVDETLGSSDIGNVSRVVPTIHPTVRISDAAVPSHSPDFARSAARSGARDATAQMARALAGLAVQLLSDPGLLRTARAEFDNGGYDAPGTDFSDLAPSPAR